MKRFPHYVAKAKSNESPQQCIWVDTETLMTKEDKDPFKNPKMLWYATHTQFALSPGESVYHWLKYGRAIYKRKHHNGKWTDEHRISFTSRDTFWSFVCDKVRAKTKLYIFCHNTSFDLPVLNVFSELPLRGYMLKSAIIDAPPTILRFRAGGKCIMIVDTLNIWRMKLSLLGEEIGLPKLEMPEDGNLNPKWEEYTDRDVEIIMEACIKWWQFLEDNDFGSFAPTLAAQSMRTYRHRYMTHPIFIDTDAKALALTREGYYGGRVECFSIGKFTGRFQSFDVNSMYPSVMASNDFPSKLVAHTVRVSLADLRNWLEQYCVAARVRIKTTEAFAPLRSGHKLIFPVGEFDCILSTPELKYALARAKVLTIYEAAVYERAPLFTEFVTDLYMRRLRAKKEGDQVKAFLYKKLLNSFYGKWGQSGGKWIEQSNIDDLTSRRWIEYDTVDKTITRFRQFGGLLQVQETKGEAKESFPAIAAHITAHARMELWRIICTSGVGNTYYCDTDSVLVNPIGADNLHSSLDDTKLGALKLVDTYEDIELFGPKDYRMGSKSKTKGVRDTATWIDAHTVEQAKWTGLRGLLATGGLNRPVTSQISKTLKRQYTKGDVLPDGSVQPYLLGSV